MNDVLVFLYSIYQSEGPAFSRDLEHMKNILRVHVLFHNGCVRFTIQQTNNEGLLGLRCGWGRHLFSGTSPRCCCFTNPGFHTCGVWEVRYTPVAPLLCVK